jgi:hypothetical protein
VGVAASRPRASSASLTIRWGHARDSGALGTLTVLLGWCLLGVGDAVNQGQFAPAALGYVLGGFVLVALAAGCRLPLRVPDGRLLAVPLVVCVVVAVTMPGRAFMQADGGRLLTIEVLAAVTAAAAALTIAVDRRSPHAGMYVVAALAAVTGIVTVALVTDPAIDVWRLLQQSSSGLLHGDDMYRQHWAHSTGLQAVYPYLPVTTVLLAPFRWLLGDVRYGLVGALLLSAFLVRRLDPRAPAGLAALLLVSPHWTFLVDQSWTEPLLLLAIAAVIVGLRQERPGIAIVALAVALACKQHIVLLLPLFALWPSFGVRRTATSVGLAVVMVLPWFLAGPRDMWHDAVHANLALGVRTRALCLPSLFAREGITVGFWFLLLALLATYALVIRRVPRTPAGLALGSALVLWALDLANKQSFFNHYTLPMGLLVIALAASERHPPAGQKASEGVSNASTAIDSASPESWTTAG